MPFDWIGKRVKVFALDAEGDPTNEIAGIGTVREADEHHGLMVEVDPEYLDNFVYDQDGLVSAETRSVEEIE